MKKTMTLNLDPREMNILEKLANKKGLSKTALIKQALRTYQALELRLEKGERIFFKNDKSRSEIILL